MRRMTYFVMALALVLGFTQCKKEQPASQNDNEGVRITLTVDGGSSNSKVAVDPYAQVGYATVTFEDGDVIYVGNNGAYCGYLEYKGSTNQFEGEVTPTSEDDYLHFYFMGNKGGESQPSSVSITDQTSKYPVISYAHSTVKYASGTTSYSANLENYCAIVKFTTTNIAADITITGMRNTVAVNFGANNAADGTGIDHNPYTPGQTNDGKITLHRESNTERWAILLPQSEVTTATASAPGYASASAFTVPAIDNNQYLTNSDAGYGITMEAVPYINANFTVDNNGTTVKFSKGNLQYQGTNKKFRFAEHQYDYVGNAEGNTAPSETQAAWIDLFGFGTSGYNSKYPYMTSQNGSDYYQYSLLNDNGRYDWGVYNKQSSQNKIENGGNHEWRTLKAAEWQYLFTNSGRGSNRYLVANITVGSDHYNGIIVFPDNYDGSIGSYTYNNSTGGWTSVSANDWSAMEALGAMFLPAAGYRQGTTVYDAGSHLSYWTTAAQNGTAQGYRVTFYNNQFDVYNLGYLVQGYSVRLVF